MLTTTDAVAAIIRVEGSRYLMQLRDERPDIWYPGYWGCFGGAVNPGETPEQALSRELYEELEFRPRRMAYLTRFDFDFGPLGLKPCYRIYYLVSMGEAEQKRLVLHEGQAVRAFAREELQRRVRVAPYDAFAIQLFEIGKGRNHVRGRAGRKKRP